MGTDLSYGERAHGPVASQTSSLANLYVKKLEPALIRQIEDWRDCFSSQLQPPVIACHINLLTNVLCSIIKPVQFNAPTPSGKLLQNLPTGHLETCLWFSFLIHYGSIYIKNACCCKIIGWAWTALLPSPELPLSCVFTRINQVPLFPGLMRPPHCGHVCSLFLHCCWAEDPLSMGGLLLMLSQPGLSCSQTQSWQYCRGTGGETRFPVLQNHVCLSQPRSTLVIQNLCIFHATTKIFLCYRGTDTRLPQGAELLSLCCPLIL